MSRIFKPIMALMLVFGLVACGSDSSTYSILATGKSFQQNTDALNAKIDILWVIDTSGSMGEEQQALADNFEYFISSFLSKNYDFRIAVTTTAAWQDLFNPAGGKAEFRQCPPGTTPPHASCTGFPIIDNQTPNPAEVFVTNIMQGTAETGDERSLQSMQAALERSLDPTSVNFGFHRPDAFLAVVIVSDEDDFSHPLASPIQVTYNPNHNQTWDAIWRYKNSSVGSYQPATSCAGPCSPTGTWGVRQHYENMVYPGEPVDPISVYTEYLDQFTGYSGAPGEDRRYSVSTFSIRALDQRTASCSSGFGGMVGIRLNEMASLTGGSAADLCGNFAEELSLIQDQIINLLVKFYLDRKPIPETLEVYVEGELIPEAASAGGEGWTYFEDDENEIYYITFSTPPPQGAWISINYDPAGLDF